MGKSSKYSIGIGLLILGVVLVVANYFMIVYENMYFPKLLVAGIIITFMGLGFVIFPGPAIDPGESSGYWKRLWKESPALNRTMWVIFTLAGIIANVFMFIYFDLKLVD